MERLKSILADKVLDLSSESGDAVKVKIDRIQRFRDFANALKSLMVKYPAIEDELITMVEDGDFDTKVASSRVDTVIRLADTEAAQINKVAPIQLDQIQIEESVVISEDEKEPDTFIEEDLRAKTLGSELTEYTSPDDIPMEVYRGNEEPLYRQEDIDNEASDDSVESENEYITYANVEEEDPNTEVIEEQSVSYEDSENLKSETDTITEDILESEEENQAEDITLTEEEKAARRKVIIKRVIQVTGIILAVVILIFIIKFVMSHWQAVLVIGGIVIVLVILFVWLKRKR
ncbi:MAG: hypothetical protein LBV71_14320 [Prevotella sp.]|jgi:hypothetical protein|nr:hypothetical protein [Prevotella sp.]